MNRTLIEPGCRRIYLPGMFRQARSSAMPNASRIVFTGAVLLCLAQAAYYYPLLPGRVASHFGASGLPDAWSSRDSFVRAYLIATGIIAILFPAIGFALKRIPTWLINLPNREYWLSTGRAEETIALLGRRFLWFGSATLLLLLDIFHQAFRVQLGYAESLRHPVASLVAYCGFALLWSIALIVRFSRKP
jgi:hypothetical protein